MVRWGGGKKDQKDPSQEHKRSFLQCVILLWSSTRIQKLLSLICTWFREASGTLRAVVPSTLHLLRHTLYHALAHIGDIGWVGIHLLIFLSVFFLRAFEQFTAINKHAQRSNRLRAG